ncbi:MAG: hypothetical protein AAB507_01350 [Patescibacteria group bacterium]
MDQDKRENHALRAKVNDAAVEIVVKLKRREEDGGFGFEMSRANIEKEIMFFVRAFGEKVLDDGEELFGLVKKKLKPEPQKGEAEIPQ